MTTAVTPTEQTARLRECVRPPGRLSSDTAADADVALAVFSGNGSDQAFDNADWLTGEILELNPAGTSRGYSSVLPG